MNPTKNTLFLQNLINILLNPLKKLAGQTIIYGLGTVVPRVLNYLLLTPFFTYIFYTNEYGVFSELYAYVAVFLIIMTYGMETTYFRFASKEHNKDKVFSNAITSVTFTGILFFIIVISFAQPIANAIKYPNNKDFIIWIALIVVLDAITAILFAKLRHENKALKFAVIKFLSVLIIIFFNAVFYYPKWSADNPHTITISVKYIFIANAIGSAFALLSLIPELFKIKFQFDFQQLKKMLKYAYPLLIVGVAGIINEHGDKIMLKYLLNTDENVMNEVGIYSANYRLAVLMTIFIQMFRYAAEPFFFSHAKHKDSKKNYADVMKYFIIFGLIIFLGVMLYIDVVKYFISSLYHEGLYIVPIILLANLFLGIYYNLSVWYKLTDKTKYGAVMAITGMIITLSLIGILVPKIGYEGAAWATFFCYFSMMLISYFWGKKIFPVPYNISRIMFYIFFAVGIYFLSKYTNNLNTSLKYITNSALFLIFVITSFIIEKKEIKTKKQ